MNRPKIKLIPSVWDSFTSQHWLWTAEQIIRNLSDEFDFILSCKVFPIEKSVDIVHPFDVTNKKCHVEFEKTLYVAHSESELTHQTPGNAKYVGVVSNYLKDNFGSQRKDSLYVVPYGIDTHIFRPLNLPKSKKLRFGWIGNKEIKGYEYVSKLENRKDIIFRPLIMDFKINKHKMRAIYGMTHYYNQIDVLIVSSSNEGFCRPVLEAAACGIPVISTNVGIAEEFIGNDEGGILIDKSDHEQREELINDAVSVLVNDPGLVEKMGKRNLDLVLSDWTWEKRKTAWRDMFMDIYEK